jgi:hypothetical protein
MSYILDALKKAAEQRGANATVLLRTSAPIIRGARLARLPWVLAGALLLLNLAGLVYLMWPAPPIPTSLPPVPPAKVSLIQPIEAPPAPAPTKVIPAEPPPAPRPAKAPVAAPASVPPVSTKPAAEKPVVVDKQVGDKAIVRITPPGATPATKADAQRFKLEVLSYSDVPAQRLVFINGRSYREGDTLDGGAVKVEQIREDSVLLLEDGQRFTLR